MSMHDDVIKRKHFPCYWPFVRGIHRSSVNSPHKGQWRGALMFSLICAWINAWVHNREAGDLRRHRAHYDVIVMEILVWTSVSRDCNFLRCWTLHSQAHTSLFYYEWLRIQRLIRIVVWTPFLIMDCIYIYIVIVHISWKWPQECSKCETTMSRQKRLSF